MYVSGAGGGLFPLSAQTTHVKSVSWMPTCQGQAWEEPPSLPPSRPAPWRRCYPGDPGQPPLAHLSLLGRGHDPLKRALPNVHE